LYVYLSNDIGTLLKISHITLCYPTSQIESTNWVNTKKIEYIHFGKLHAKHFPLYSNSWGDNCSEGGSNDLFLFFGGARDPCPLPLSYTLSLSNNILEHASLSANARVSLMCC
jgi:hypothetical protein